MRPMLIAILGSILYLLMLSVYVKLIRQQRQRGRADLAKRYTAIIVIMALPMVVIPWSHLL